MNNIFGDINKFRDRLAKAIKYDTQWDSKMRKWVVTVENLRTESDTRRINAKGIGETSEIALSRMESMIDLLQKSSGAHKVTDGQTDSWASWE